MIERCACAVTGGQWRNRPNREPDLDWRHDW